MSLIFSSCPARKSAAFIVLVRGATRGCGKTTVSTPGRSELANSPKIKAPISPPRKGVKLIGMVDLPDTDKLQIMTSYGLPTKWCPSDHLPLTMCLNF